MSKTLGNALLSSTCVLENQDRRRRGPRVTFGSSTSRRYLTTSQKQNPPPVLRVLLLCRRRPNKFLFNTTRQQHSGMAAVGAFPKSNDVLLVTTDPVSQVSRKFCLDEDSVLQVTVSPPSAGSPLQIDLNIITNNSSPMVLHWGVIRQGQRNWSLPSCSPDGTTKYKNRALRTPFQTSGSSSSLKIQINEPDVDALEFLVLDEACNRWFKDNGQNFRVSLPRRAKANSFPVTLGSKKNISLPEDLVQIQAYLRWERKGKQNYTPVLEKEEYEAARFELLEEVARGVSVDELRKKLTGETENGNEPHKKSEQHVGNVAKGDAQTAIPKEVEKTKHFAHQGISRKKRDIMQILHKYPSEAVEEKKPDHPEMASTLDLFLEAKVKQDDAVMLNSKTFKLGNKELRVLVSRCKGKTKICLATDLNGPLVLHWALSKKVGEWMLPPSTLLPPNTVLLEKACETPFDNKCSEDRFTQVQVVEIVIDGCEFSGMPFVIHSDGHWIKNNGYDFYVKLADNELKVEKDASFGVGTAKTLLDKISELECEAERSFMHRFNIAADLTETAEEGGKLGFVGLFVWMRFMTLRQLTWNKNYNVKPREISKAQDRLIDLLQNAYKRYPQHREILRMIMSTVGRGGEGDVGQRIRDEILVIQRNNDCKGGMMEEWHQKLHNNTSPDDVVICQALIDYVKSDFDINFYWNTLTSHGITKERLLSYDRAIRSEPSFRGDQKDGLLRDLGNYLRTLKAVHSGADLESAISTCMGYNAEGEGFMVGVQINPVRGLPSGFPELLQSIIEHKEDSEVGPLIGALLEAREELSPILQSSHERLKDLIFLDIALDSTVRTVIERGYEELHNASPERLMYFITLVLENLAMSSDDNEDLIYCLKGWYTAIEMTKRNDVEWALFAKSFLDRTRLALSKKAENYEQVLQPSAEYLGSLLGVDDWAISIFTEEIIRAGSAAALSGLLNRLGPILRKVANLGSWQVISPVEVAGYIDAVDELLSVQHKSYEKPTVLIAKSVRGEEEIPDGVVAVLTHDMPDVLSHVSVRARNCKICFATCFDLSILDNLWENKGKLFHLTPTSGDIIYREIKESESLNGSPGNLEEENSASSITLARKQFSGRYAISSQEFSTDMVGSKSRNIGFLKGKLPTWIGIPTSIALPFGVFEKVLWDDSNKDVIKEWQTLKERLDQEELGVLGEIRRTVLQLKAPPQLVTELNETMQEAGLPWPVDNGENRWEQVWMAIKKVWASRWNERAYISTRKAKLDHDDLCMAVLVQEVINADYAFVIHTTNPSSGDSSEIYAEVVKGLGETLVGAYPGRALSFSCQKADLNSPRVLGYPSKPIGLFIRPSLIFRSDSNGEDLEGYAGAGLYDSVTMDPVDEVILDYSSDPLIVDRNFCQSLLSRIAQTGKAIEELFGSPQDIEGVVKDGKITVVQTRPQI